MLRNIVLSLFWRIFVSTAIAESILLVVPLVIAGAMPLFTLLAPTLKISDHCS